MNRSEGFPTRRGIEQYVTDLGLHIEDIRDKRILDVGAGFKQFAKDVEEADIGAEVFSVDPFYARTIEGGTRELSEESETPGTRARAVAGRAEALPFADSSFDLVVCNFSVPFYAKSTGQIRAIFSELLRVVRPGGEVRINPITNLESINPLLPAYISALLLNKEVFGGIEVEQTGQLAILRKRPEKK